ncbi:tRNA pseudouridine(38-40) synthase TruA [Vagococcus acidifermentans]|uniref:tRNA pseudouridine synthase A n=1 Tax=Vagococcus acidifermentans TaxID=564710 RepID=A0A430B2K8_9ENTE|nr:tRNA pseudouridine(38-40) synthase TruA [Vagococcus acidifermentans]RSU14481.1 tRNA pseudouridine(38-40) synthase TruA [Vagococcus acidifermentans]
MPRYKAVIAYDGTHYAGFQIQQNAHTIQAEIEQTLSRLNNQQHVTIHPSGRTDAGVHAKGQVIHFDYPHVMDEERFRFALDTQTPADISVRKLERVSDDFHARYLVKEKIYEYYVDLSKSRDPFKRLYATHYIYPLDIPRMQRAAKAIEGTHDFSVFCATGTKVTDKTRTVYDARIERIGETGLKFTFRGNGFLYKMVRMLVGTLLKIGNGRLPEQAIELALATCDKKMTGPTAAPEGLFLSEVKY